MLFDVCVPFNPNTIFFFVRKISISNKNKNSIYTCCESICEYAAYKYRTSPSIDAIFGKILFTKSEWCLHEKRRHNNGWHIIGLLDIFHIVRMPLLLSKASVYIENLSWVSRISCHCDVLKSKMEIFQETKIVYRFFSFFYSLFIYLMQKLRVYCFWRLWKLRCL